MLACSWQLPLPYHHVLRYHHEVERASEHRCLVAIVSLCDLLCRLRNLGYGFEEIGFVDLATEPAWTIAAEELTTMRNFDLARFTMELDTFITEVEQSVATLFQLV